MMWLCIEASGRAKLALCSQVQDSQAYQDDVLTPNLNFIRVTGPDRGRTPIIFMQDGASCHTSISTRKFLAENRVKVLQNWPANSPDLNPVENCWSWLARRLVGQKFETEAALEEAIRKEWEQRQPTLIPSCTPQ